MRISILLEVLFLCQLNTIGQGFLFSRTTCRTRYNMVWCFTNTGPYRTMEFPRQPGEIGTNFRLYTRSNEGAYQELFYHEPDSILNSFFNSTKKTNILVHGYLEHGGDPWILELKDAILDREDVNIIVVDYGTATGTWARYDVAVGDARLVGQELAYFITVLQEQTNVDLADIHVIAFSLGCPIAGWAGEKLGGKLGRITGLDAARVGFISTDPQIRLDKTDAQFVDAIHTSTGSVIAVGVSEAYAHIDFYPDGGDNHPGCIGLLDVICNHVRARYFMIDSVVDAAIPMMGYPCENLQDFNDGKCNECGKGGCAKMGYYATKPLPNTSPTTYYLKTAKQAPYAILV